MSVNDIYMVHPAYSNLYNWRKVTGETQSDIFSQIDLCRPGRRTGGPPVSHITTLVDIDVLEQWWLAQVGLAAAGGPHDVQRSPGRSTAKAVVAPEEERLGRPSRGGRVRGSKTTVGVRTAAGRREVLPRPLDRPGRATTALGHLYRPG